MENLLSVLIGIQARSTSQRLPKKAFEPIGGKRMLDHVIDACAKAAKYSNRRTFVRNFSVNVAILIPENDPIKRGFSSPQVQVVEGSEADVLSRFVKAAKHFKPDYICRITGDCPMIPPFVISKHISLCVTTQCDYVSNVDEECRLSLDGIDCEVMSAKMLQWLDENAKSPSEREHVTILARTNPPPWAKRGFTASFFDHSDIKLSVDTPEDLRKVRLEYDRVGRKINTAQRIYGSESIYRF